MVSELVGHQEHGYRGGHKLLSTTLKLPRADQETIDRLSDISGQIRPGEEFAPYLTAYPLPSMSHFVVARTWQDLEAPRAGCVLTHSLLVPLQTWIHAEHLDDYLELLHPPEALPRKAKAAPVKVPALSHPVSDRRSIELVEALFLEGRKPIVFFEASQAELIALKLLTALWPGMRRNFAVCTFALAPRKIGGRDFDLVFAPKSVRARFADWKGRRIEVSNQTVARHRWSEATATQIFNSPAPSLKALDSLGVLERDINGDESALRLALLWNELASRAETTPTAVLGMLDILNSQQREGSEVWEELGPLIEHAIEISTTVQPAAEGWKFLGTLIGKFSRSLPPKPIRRTIQRVTTNLARKEASTALEFLAVENDLGSPLERMFLSGVADGLARGGELCALNQPFDRLSTRLKLALMASSSTFAREVLACVEREPHTWLDTVIPAFQSADFDAQRRARRKLVPYIDHPAHAPLLTHLLDGISKADLLAFVQQVGRNTQFEVEEFTRPIVDAAVAADAVDETRNLVAEQFDGMSADRFLLETIRMDRPSIDWLADGPLPRVRARDLAIQLVRDSNDRHLHALPAETQEQLLSMLRDDLGASAREMARLLAVGRFETLPFIESAMDVLQRYESPSLVEALLKRALSDAPAGSPLVASIISQQANETDAWNLITWSTYGNTAPKRVSENVLALEAAPARLRRSILSHINYLSERLISCSCSSLEKEAYEAWARLIEDAGRFDGATQLAAAGATLPYALRHTREPVSPLVRVCFPLVYERLAKSKGPGELSLIPTLLMLPWFLVTDWDKAKPARRDLIEAFLRSNWPPTDLMVTALHAGIEFQVLNRLSESYAGMQYINSIEEDASKLSSPLGRQIAQVISAFRDGESPTDWD